MDAKAYIKEWDTFKVRMECPVCRDGYNITNHKRVSCAFCDYSCCRRCVQTYLLSTVQDAHCMSCKHLWNREFIDSVCTKSFRNGEYRKHREKILLEKEKILMPATQVFVSRELKAREYMRHIHDIQQRIDTLVEQRNILSENVHLLRHTSIAVDGEGGDQRKFVRKCPIEDCRGFLSTQWKCGLCQSHICNKCNERKGEDEHTCDPRNVETMELLKKDTKGCPTCGTMITFIDGCRQMWCPSCHTAFDWHTLRIDTGRIHNPHYYEFKLKSGMKSREHGDIPCGGIPDIYEMCGALNVSRRSVVERLPLPAIDLRFMNIHRCIIHIERIELRFVYNIDGDNGDNKDLRMSYMLNEISEIEFMKKVQRREKAREKKRDIYNILQMFVDTGGDLLRQFVMNRDKKNEIYELLGKLVDYTNHSLYVLTDRYNCIIPPRITSNWEFYK